jgi:glutamate racemase
VVRIYLSELLAEAKSAGQFPDTLVLGCTHYPLLREVFEKALPEGIRVVDSAEATAAEAARRLTQVSATPTTKTHHWGPRESRAGAPAFGTSEAVASIRCFATDSVEKFERLGSRFLGLPVGKVELVDLGG